MVRIILVIAMLMAVFFTALGKDITGSVCDESGRKLPDISVIGLTIDSIPTVYSFTNEEGRFCLPNSQSSDEGDDKTDATTAILKFAGLGYESVYVDIEGEGRLMTEVILKSKELKLNEVVVAASDITQKGDTINFNVGSFTTATDRKVIDVLKKMPGITVTDDSKIEFNGKRIANLYVEGLNLTGEQYSQITNGVNSGDISTVQVLQNNQPVKMLRGIVPSDQVDINLKLKEGRKDVWAVNSEAGGGWLDKNSLTDPLSYGLSVSPMQFNKEYQTISSILISDNQVTDPTSDDTGADLRQSNDFLTSLSMFMPARTGLSGIPFFRQSGLKTGNLRTNWIKGNNEKRTARLNIGLSKGVSSQNASIDKEYVAIEGCPMQILEESADCEKYTGYLGMEIKQNNSDHFVTFLSNSYLERDNSRNGNILNGVERNDRQRFFNFTTDNRFTYKRLLDNKNIFSLSGVGAFTILNNSLSILSQSPISRTSYKDGSLKLNTDLIFKVFGVKGNCETQLGYDFKEVATNLPESDSFNDHRVSLRISPGIDCSFERYRIALGLPIDIVYHRYDNHKGFTPLLGGSLFVTYRLNAFWEGSCNILYSQKQSGIYDLIPFSIFTSFDSRRRGSGNIYKSDNLGCMINIRYADMIKGFSGYIKTNLLYAYKSPLVKSSLHDEVSIIEVTDKYGSTVNITTRGQIAKRFKRLMSLLSLTGTLGYTLGHGLSDESIYPIDLTHRSLRLKFSASPLSWLILESGGEISSSRQTLKSPMARLTSKVSSYTADGKLSVVLGNFIATTGMKFMKNSLPDSPVLTLYDTELAYKLGKYEVVVKCENILNNKEYKRKFMSTTLYTTYTTLLRPRQLMATLRINF